MNNSFLPVLLLFTWLQTGSFLTLPGLNAQTRASYFDQEAQLILPENFDAGKTYPLLVLFPYTGGSAEDFYLRIDFTALKKDFAVLLPQGTPRSENYLPDFMSYVKWTEERLLKDLEGLKHRIKIDPRGIVLGGFSLGGDLSWALILRNPGLFRGAVMAGTRASYPPPRGAMETLRQAGFRGVFIVGQSELAVRAAGIAAAHRTLKDRGLEVEFREVPGGHVFGPPEDFVQALEWVSGR